MKLYHGSTVDISEIDLSLSKPNKDFGKGFYLTDNPEQAHRMAAYKAAQYDMQPVHDYDIVYGPIANDRVGIQIRNYMERNIDLRTFLERLKYMKGITFQYFFGTDKAISLLHKI